MVDQLRIGGRITLFIRMDLETDLMKLAAAALLVYVLYPLLMPLTKLRARLEKHLCSTLMIRADGLSFGRLSCATRLMGAYLFGLLFS